MEHPLLLATIRCVGLSVVIPSLYIPAGRPKTNPDIFINPVTIKRVYAASAYADFMIDPCPADA